MSLVELITYRRKGHAEHDNQSYVPAGEIDRWALENDPIDRYVARLRGEFGFTDDELRAMDERVRREIDEATEVAERSPPPEPLDALVGVYASPPQATPLWFRSGKRSSGRVRASAPKAGAPISASNGCTSAERQTAREND